MRLLETGSLPIDEIIIEDRLRQVDHLWAQGLAEIIRETGLHHAIEVVKISNQFRLVAGAHRLAAVKILEWDTIPVRIMEPETERPELEIRLDEIVENVGRRELSALDRAVHIAELKTVLTNLKGETRGRKKKGQQLPLFLLNEELSTRIGLSTRTIKADVQLIKGLSTSTAKRISGSWLADNRAELVRLSKLEKDQQTAVLGLLLGEVPKATTIASALSVLSGETMVKQDGELMQLNRFIKIWAGAGRGLKDQIKTYIAENP